VWLPYCEVGKPVEWLKPSIWGIERILKNPGYAGRYCYRARVSDLRLGRDRRGHTKVRRALPEETITHDNAHPAYLTMEIREEILEILRSNRYSRRHPISSTGSTALLAGLLRCRRHRKIMSPRSRPPRKDGSRFYQYQCQGRFLDEGKDYCGTVPDTVGV
jgi:hypothetical protein